MSENKLIAKKSLGQHFLRSEKALNQIIENIERADCIFEIGPGEGVLTERILKLGMVVFAIEIDRDAIFLLKNKFKEEIENKKLFIIEKDCLEINYAEIIKQYKFKNYFLVGNIPYYITGAIFRNTFEQKVLPQQIIFLVQKEVAVRIIAKDKKESILSVSIKIFSAQVKIIDIVKAGSFVPPPKVDSAILAINNIINPFSTKEKYEIFFKILKAAFSHKRKFLLSNLKTDLDKNLFDLYFEKIKETLEKKYSEKIRAEDLSILDWTKIIAFLDVI